MAKKNKSVPQYGTVTRKGILYYRTRIQDADDKQKSPGQYSLYENPDRDFF